MFQGKKKAITFSYDDGVTQDARLIKILDRYGLKCTFNINSGTLGNVGGWMHQEKIMITHTKFFPSEVPSIYKGHEVAAHTCTHPVLRDCDRETVIREVEDDRVALSKLVGYEVCGMAYPMGTAATSDETVRIIRENVPKIGYARGTESTYRFDLQSDLLRFEPTVRHTEWDELFTLGEKFVAMQTDVPQIFYIWGHAYEFDYDNSWNKFEEFCKMISGKDDIFYGTNKEVLLGRFD